MRLDKDCEVSWGLGRPDKDLPLNLAEPRRVKGLEGLRFQGLHFGGRWNASPSS